MWKIQLLIIIFFDGFYESICKNEMIGDLVTINHL